MFYIEPLMKCGQKVKAKEIYTGGSLYATQTQEEEAIKKIAQAINFSGELEYIATAYKETIKESTDYKNRIYTYLMSKDDTSENNVILLTQTEENKVYILNTNDVYIKNKTEKFPIILTGTYAVDENHSFTHMKDRLVLMNSDRKEIFVAKWKIKDDWELEIKFDFGEVKTKGDMNAINTVIEAFFPDKKVRVVEIGEDEYIPISL